ncbi:hypothetical protein Bca101_089232 [Brassica carinata]
MQQKQGHPVVEVLTVGARRNSMLELDGAVVRGGDKMQKRLGTYAYRSQITFRSGIKVSPNGLRLLQTKPACSNSGQSQQCIIRTLCMKGTLGLHVMARLRQRKNSDPENFTQGGGRAAGGATRGGRAARGAIGGGRGGNNNIPRAGGTYTPGDANLDIMRIIQEEAQKRDEDITKGGEDTGYDRERKKLKKIRSGRVQDKKKGNTCYRIWLLNPRKLELVAVAAVPLANILQCEYLRWINIVRAMRGKELLEKLEKVESFNYAFIMFIKIMAIQLYCIHTTGCMLYQLATDFEGLPQIYQTWMSDIQIGNQNLSGLGNVQKYIASTYFATVTLSTVGYGDIHATNLTEMVALACLIIVSLTVWTYLGVQLANFFGRRSKKQIVGEKMDNLEKYLKEAKIAENLAEDIRGHMQMKYSDDYDRKILEDVPACLIAKASGAQQDFHPPGCTVLKEGNIVSQLHILYKGGLELLQGGTVHPPLTRPTTVFGLESFVLNEPLPHTIRTYKASKFLIISKKYFMECLHNYLEDGASVMKNLSNDFAINRGNTEIISFLMSVVAETNTTAERLKSWECVNDNEVFSRNGD